MMKSKTRRNNRNNHLDNAVFGIRPVIEAINEGKTIDKLFIQKGLKGDLFSELWNIVRSKRINYKHVPIEKMNRLTRKNHQGVFAFISPIDFHQLENIIPTIYEEGQDPLILILDKISDVRNFGAIARTAECAGVNTILITTDGAAAINGDAIKTSAGALYKIPICRTSNLKKSLQFIKDSGLQIIGCTEKGKDNIYDVNFNSPTAIIMGSEDDGISPAYLRACDIQSKIPMRGSTSSLNVSVATGVILFEANKQRLIIKK